MTALILVVEDQRSDILLAQRAFARAGIKVPLQVITDGDAAVRYLSGAKPYDDRQRFPFPCLLVLDLRLPRRSGHEVLAWIRESPELVGAQIPVVMVSTSNDADDRERAFFLGARQFLVKPLNGEIVAGMLRQVGLDELMDDRRRAPALDLPPSISSPL